MQILLKLFAKIHKKIPENSLMTTSFIQVFMQSTYLFKEIGNNVFIAEWLEMKVGQWLDLPAQKIKISKLYMVKLYNLKRRYVALNNQKIIK